MIEIEKNVTIIHVSRSLFLLTLQSLVFDIGPYIVGSGEEVEMIIMESFMVTTLSKTES